MAIFLTRSIFTAAVERVVVRDEDDRLGADDLVSFDVSILLSCFAEFSDATDDARVDGLVRVDICVCVCSMIMIDSCRYQMTTSRVFMVGWMDCVCVVMVGGRGLLVYVVKVVII